MKENAAYTPRVPCDKSVNSSESFMNNVGTIILFYVFFVYIDISLLQFVNEPTFQDQTPESML